MIPKLVNIKSLQGYTIWVEYSDGVKGEYDLYHLSGKGVFKAWDSTDLFCKVYIDKDTNAIAWNEEIDICPDNVYFRLSGTTFEEWKASKNAYA